MKFNNIYLSIIEFFVSYNIKMIKKIFIYWDANFENASFMIKECLKSWKKNNIDWEIIELYDNNLNNYIDRDELEFLNEKNITKTHYSDIIRLVLLEKYGGCWCDATTFCNKNLSEWLINYISSGFFAFNYDKNAKYGGCWCDATTFCNKNLSEWLINYISSGFFAFNYDKNAKYMLSSWFLYAEKNNYIISTWKNELLNYWRKNDIQDDYFLLHNLFKDLYIKDSKFKKIWDDTTKIDTNLPHFLQWKSDIYNDITDKERNHINNKLSPLYKLNRRKWYDNKYNKNTVIYYLFNT